MKISTRLSLAFSFIASATFIAFGVAVYFFVENHRKNEFKDRLTERLFITEKFILEKESFSSLEFEKIKTQFLNTLPKETEEVIKLDNNNSPQFKFKYPQKAQESMLAYDNYYFETEETQGQSKVFNVKGSNYLIIVSAVDLAGLQNLSFLKFSIMILTSIGIPLIWIGSFIITKKALSPLNQKIQRANAISASNLDQRLEVFNPEDEIGMLAIAFNKLLDRLELAFDAQKSFISNASHEIKNPLTAIMGEAEIAASKSRTPQEYIDSLDIIISEAEMLNSTVNNLLQLAKVTANQEAIPFERIDFITFFNEVKTSFDFIYPKNNLAIDQPDLGNTVSILGNKNLLQSAFFNLFDNALKFSNNEEVRVTVSLESEFVKITIRDKGQGISNEDLKNVKAPFYRGNNAIQIKGSGIGLSLTDKIIGLHKGKLTIESTLDVGTSVEVSLPLV